MSHKRKPFILAVLVSLFIFVLGYVPINGENNSFEAGSAAENNLTTIYHLNDGDMNEKQLSSIAMLNHITVLSQEINASSNSRLYLDNVYSDIVNNINPNAVDEDSMYQIRVLLNTIHAYQSIETKRERIQYIYEQNQANAIQHAIPSPMSILNIVQSTNPMKALVSVVFLAVDSANSYKSYLNDVDQKYIESGWQLDDAAADNLHESRKEAFTYMVKMCQKNNLDGRLALNEKSVEDFVTWENNSNPTRRIDFLEKNESTYQAYGKYWLILAESYYEIGEYQKCLDSIEKYEELGIDTFRKDHDLAKASSMAIDSASQLYSGSKYVTTAEHYLDIILNNIESEDWLLRYFASQSFMSLYSQTNKKEYLQKAYDLAEENVNYLINVQHDKNKEYTSDLVKEVAKKDATKQQKEEVNQYNKWIEEERKVAVPPVYQPLVLNCDLLFGLAEELNISSTEKSRLNEILHAENQPLFLVRQLDNLYRFDNKSEVTSDDFGFDGELVKIPAVFVEQGASIKVTVKNGSDVKTYEDWIIDKVTRGTKDNVETYTVVFSSKAIKKLKYSTGTTVEIELLPPEESNYDGMSAKFNTTVGKKFIFLDDVKFEMVK